MGKMGSAGGISPLQTATYARSGDPLWRWRKALAASPSTVKIVLNGDSTMDSAAQAGDLFARLKTFHTQTGKSLAGMTADTSHFVNRGYNGMSLATWLGDPTKLAALVADAPDLIVASWLINDVRLGGLANAAAGTALLTQYVDAVRAALPNTPMVLRIPSSLTTTNSGGSNYVQSSGGSINPAGAAQTYSTLMREAYQALTGVYQQVLIADVQAELTGTVSRATHPLMGDQIHPGPASSTFNGTPYGGGQVAVADYLAHLIGNRANARDGISAPFPIAGYRGVRRFIIIGGGSGYFDMASPYEGGNPADTAAAQFPISTADILIVDGIGQVTISSASFVRPQSGSNIRVFLAGDYTTYAGKAAWVGYNHPDSTTGDRQEVTVDLASIAAGATAVATVTVTGAVTGNNQNSTGIIASPPAAFDTAGLVLLNAYPSAADTVKLVVLNPTGGAIDAAAGSWRFWVVR